MGLLLLKNRICIYGENGVGKTNFLESLVTSNYHRIQKTFSERVVELTLHIELDKESDLYKVLKNSQLEVTCIVENDRYSYKIKKINGIDTFLNEIEYSLKTNEIEFKQKISEYLNMLEEFKKLRDKVYSSDYYSPKFHNDFFDFNNSKMDKIDGLINGLEGFLNRDKNFEINREDLTFPQFDYWFRHNIYIFTDTYISLDRYNDFKERYKDCTLELHGLEIDFDSIDKKVEQVNRNYKEIIEIINSYLDRYKSTYTEDKRETIHDILKQVNYVTNELNKLITKYVNDFKYFPNHLEKYGMHNNNFNKEEYITILSILGVDIPKESDYKLISDGEKWMMQFATEMSTYQDCLVLIDEPGVFLNPALQKNVLKVFDYLELKGCQIIYTTHSHFLLDFSPNNICLKLTDSSNPNFEKLIINKNYSIDNIQLGEILMLSTKQIILVEGICDKKLIGSIMTKNLGLNTSNIVIYDCNGDGIIPILDFCITSNIDFKAIIDNDKYDELVKIIGSNRLDGNKKRIKLVGLKDKKNKIEDLLSNKDEKLLCLPSKKECHNGEMHLDHEKIKRAFKQGKHMGLSKKLINGITQILKDLQII